MLNANPLRRNKQLAQNNVCIVVVKIASLLVVKA